MRCCFRLLSSFAFLFVSAPLALAGPWDVPNNPEVVAEVEPTLKPYQKLKPNSASSARVRAALPDPVVEQVTLNDGQIAVSDSSSLLAQFGVLDAEATGFRYDVWQYLSAADAKRYVEQVSPSMLAPLNARLGQLLQLQAATPEKADAAWFIARVKALNQLGETEKAAAMLAAIPQGMERELHWLVAFELFASQGNPKRACEGVDPDARPEAVSAEHWLRLVLFCAAQAGDFAKVELAQSMAEEQAMPMVSWFSQLLETIQYGQGELPTLPSDVGPLDVLMLKAIEKQRSAGTSDAAKDTEAEVEYPKNPSYALLALAKHIRAGQLELTSEWLQMLDRQSSAAAGNFVVHELVRFLTTNPAQSRSEEANMLPSFTAIEGVLPTDITLLRRYYAMLDYFGFDLPMTTAAWLEEQPAEAWRNVAANGLVHAKQAGNVAGYLFELNLWLQANPLENLSNEAIGQRIEELLYLGEDGLARALATEAILLALH